MKYNPAMKRNKVLILKKAQINLRNIMLSKRSFTQKSTYCMIPHRRQGKLIQEEMYQNGGCLWRDGDVED